MTFALTYAKADESGTCRDMIPFTGLEPTAVTFIADEGCRRASYGHQYDIVGVTLIR